MKVTVLEHVVRRSGLALQLTDLATGAPVTDGITVSAWPAGRPEWTTTTRTVTAAGVAGFRQLPGIGRYEDGSTDRDDWFASPPVLPPIPMVVRVTDGTGDHLPVTRTVSVPSALPLAVALPRSPAATVPSGRLAVVANVVTETGAAAPWAVVQLAIGPFVTGGLADEGGAVVIPVPKAVPPTSTGTAAGGPSWTVTVTVRFRLADQVAVPDARPDDPPSLPSLLAQPAALVRDGAAFVPSMARQLTTGGPLVVASRPAPQPSVLVVRPTP